jgi:chaperone required for assembly of F1-ATPase
MTDETDDERMQRLSRDHYERPLAKRFYKVVSVTAELGIALDGRSVKTPMKAAFVAPNRRLAEAIAVEWDAQDKFINPGVMPLTRYTNTAIDRATSERDSIIAECVQYAGSDLVCYRATTPPDLVAAQKQYWDAVLAWAAQHLGADFKAHQGVIHKVQEQAALDAVQQRISALNGFELTAVYNLMTLTGSILLALMLQAGAHTAEEGWATALVDEDHQIKHWGEDWEATKRRASRLIDYHACLQFLVLSQK